MIIVTGGAGFIGSNIVKALNAKGIKQIIVVDSLKNPSKHLNLNGCTIEDFVDKEDFIKSLGQYKNIRTIFHLGACSDTMETDGRYMMKNNYEYSKALLDFALLHNIDFIYASSASVYGNGDSGFKEDPSCEYPLNIYAFSKYMFDNYVRNIFNYKKNLSSQICGIRYFNVYGYQENHKGRMASVAFHLMNQIKDKEPMKLFEGSQNFKRDFIFIEDAVKINLFFFEKKVNGIFNCGTGKAQSFNDIALALQKMNPKTEIKYIPFPDQLIGKYQGFTEADLTRLRKAGFTENFNTVEEGVKKYYNQFIKTGGYLI
ncbi:MAG: ADP-glyceromanno-heptose 6-epimerase [Candidatus Margulisbacteria bacterium]|nr:ADP-glyceromanno-heptose 6-epimerase [Candidatus Margulisiibacteriota bacterium]